MGAPETCFIYVAATFSGDKWGSPIKVGITSSLKQRLRTIRTGCPFPVTFFQYWDMANQECARQIEGAFHHLHADKAMAGEWFSIEPKQACVLIEIYCRQTFAMTGVATSRRINARLGPIASRVPDHPVWLEAQR